MFVLNELQTSEEDLEGERESDEEEDEDGDQLARGL